MKKKIVLSVILLFSLGLVRPVLAEEDGRLQFDPNVIINSKNSANTQSDFPIRDQLFSKTLTQAVKQKQATEAKAIDQGRSKVDFKPQKADQVLLSATKIKGDLFSNYQPKAQSSNSSNSQTKGQFWLWLTVVIGLPLVVLSAFLGRWRAKRKRRSARANTD